ncbi:MAG: rRNA maturation RNase YbeY [Brevefilum sp.]|nr:rRNA maturation RNase YbeY [Brevefilum sp.]MDT8380796.1 rRNA maturation RNase YbeY [Brevefilum sp.]MDW7753617.1 rRNA maturation RNase YbeY [Brevefilum sp.]
MITIQKSRHNLAEIDLSLIKAAVKNTLAYLDQLEVDITIQLTDDREIAEINQSYRGEAKATDVLSFNQDFTDPDTGHLYLGDILISIETAAEQAPDYDLSLDEEIAFLAIHGTLHLSGFDHYEPDEKEEMWKIQDKIFLMTIKQFQEKF